MPPRRPRRLLVQATRPVPELRRAPHVRRRRECHRLHLAQYTLATMGVDLAFRASGLGRNEARCPHRAGPHPRRGSRTHHQALSPGCAVSATSTSAPPRTAATSPRPTHPLTPSRALSPGLAGGTFMGRPFPAGEHVGEEDLDRKEPRFSATCNGFDVHCAVRVEAGGDERRERLVRYCARPPFALSRIELLKDGRVAYRLKTPRRGKTHRIMTSVEFLARLAILVPPPYFPLVRYHSRCVRRALVVAGAGDAEASRWRAPSLKRRSSRAPCARAAP